KEIVEKVGGITIVRRELAPIVGGQINAEMPKKYEVRLFNQEVRDAVEMGDKNTSRWSDSWADAHYENVDAFSPREAIDKVFRKFPEKEGFVITHVVEIDEENGR